MLVEPALPYGGTSGHMKPETSRRRAEIMDEIGGSTSMWQERLLEALQEAGVRGLASWEFKDMYPGKTSSPQSVFSTTFKEGWISRLTQVRTDDNSDRFGYVHVLPSFVNGRATIPYEPQKKHLHTAEGIERAQRMVDFLRERVKGTMTPERAAKLSHESQPGDAELAGAIVYLLSFSVPKEGKLKALKKRRPRKRQIDQA